MKKNLFSTWYNSLLTVVFGAFILWAVYSLVKYLLGVDTEIIVVNLRLYMTGRFPAEQFGRLWAAVFVTTAGIGFFARTVMRNGQRKAAEAGLEFERSRWQDIVRRFWPIGALVLFTLSFTRTFTPALLTLVAIPIGMLIGYGLCGYLAFRFDTDLYRIPLVLGMNVYALSALIVILSALVSGLMIWRNLAHLDMVAVLKTRE